MPEPDDHDSIQREADATSSAQDAQAANLFDLRRIIGGLFLVYGAILTVVGATDGHAEISRAAGVHINLWAGLGMLLLGAFFVVWALWRPLGEQLAEEERAAEA